MNGQEPTRTTDAVKDADAQKGRGATYLLLHLLLVIYSLNGICSKLASQHPFLSWKFILLYGCGIVFLGIYAIGWQQVIKRLPLTTAYANRAVTVAWGIVWGVLIFKEPLNVPKTLGALVVLIGVALYAWADGRAIERQEGGDASC